MGYTCGLCDSFKLRKRSKKHKKRHHESMRSLQSFKELLPADPRLDINSAAEEQFQTLPGITPELASAIITHRTKIGEFKSINDLVCVPDFGGTKTLNLLRPEIKCIKKPDAAIAISCNPRSKNLFRVGYFPLGSEFDIGYCKAIGVKDVICSYILRNTLDLIVFTGEKLEECKENFIEVLSELEDPNIPKIKLTRDRGKWQIIPLNTEGDSSTISLIALNSEKVKLMEDKNAVLRLKLSSFFSNQQILTLSHSTSFSPSLLVSKNHFSPSSYSDTGAIKLSSILLSSKISPNGPKYESNLENLKSSYIPNSPSSPVGRITSLKPEYLELNLI
ncbi:unnamed protein product [Oikopleura dioica]|uniref:Uncharacterized protein n=1 Tax=Oikopleura dioica TaxID=34765 RepID=E4WV97_OIKDI|nr:unnamed protein product [Oikopleura dioica]